MALAKARVNSFKATRAAEKLASKRNSPGWKKAAEEAVVAQRKLAALDGKIALEAAEAAMKVAQAKADKDATGGDPGIAAKSAIAVTTAKKPLAIAEKAMAKADKDLTAPAPPPSAPSSRPQNAPAASAASPHSNDSFSCCL